MYKCDIRPTNGAVTTTNLIRSNADKCAAGANAHIRVLKGTVRRQNGDVIQYDDYTYKASDNSGYVLWAGLPKGADSIKYFPTQCEECEECEECEDSIANNLRLIKK